MKHWATKYIGRPWVAGGCWLLVQDVFRERYGIAMPDVQIGEVTDVENVAALKRAATVSGWRPVGGDPASDDIVLMVGVDGRRHVGVMISTIRGLAFLHCDGHMTKAGPVGSVVAVPLKSAMTDGYGQIEIWRRA